MIYVNDKPILLVCDNTVYIKKLDCLAELMKDAPIAIPYPGAKERYILDIENHQLTKEIISILEPITPLPKPKRKNKNFVEISFLSGVIYIILY
ncbi:MAG: transcriptional regulator [Acutalibacteraceae bacterium]